MIIAIDGYSSSGKSTIAKGVAKQLGIVYVDTGAMYRCVTLFALQNGMINNGELDENTLKARINKIKIDFITDNGQEKAFTFLNGKNVEDEIRSLRVSEYVSPVSKLKFVRNYLVALQRKMGENKSIVMDGRDIGTVVFPNADLKIFMNANAETRAKRRYKELIEKGQDVNFDEIKQNIESRDLIDSTRKESPLRKADDAIELDNSEMGLQEQLDWILDKIKQKSEAPIKNNL